MKVPLFEPYQDYQIDTEGNVYGKDGKLKKYRKSGYGYNQVVLFNNRKHKNKMVHRLMAQMFLPDFDDNLFVDHIDRNKLNNCISNLRMVTHQQNLINRTKQVNNTSGYKGICWCKRDKKWVAHIKYNQKQIHIGNFDDIEDARETYNSKARELFGEYAYQEPKREKLKINFIMNITNATHDSTKSMTLAPKHCNMTHFLRGS